MSKEVVYVGTNEGTNTNEQNQSLAQKPLQQNLQYETLQKTFQESGTGLVPNTFYTCPQGKRFLIYGFSFAEIGGAAQNGNFYLLDRTGAVQLFTFGLINQYQPSIQVSYNPPLIVSEGYKLQVASNGAHTVTLNMFGYEIDKY